MAPLSGTAGSVVYMTGGTTNIVGIGEWSLDIGMDTVETTDFGDQWRERIAGLRQFSGSFGGFSSLHTSQTMLRNAMLGGSAISLRLHDSGTTFYNVPTAFLTGLSPSVAMDGRVEISYNFEGSGSLTYV